MFGSGGGIGGLLLAVALSKYPDIQVDVYEAAKLFSEVGAGIGLWPRSWKIIEQLGLADELAKIAVVPPTNIPSTFLYIYRQRYSTDVLRSSSSSSLQP